MLHGLQQLHYTDFVGISFKVYFMEHYENDQICSIQVLPLIASHEFVTLMFYIKKFLGTSAFASNRY